MESEVNNILFGLDRNASGIFLGGVGFPLGESHTEEKGGINEEASSIAANFPRDWAFWTVGHLVVLTGNYQMGSAAQRAQMSEDEPPFLFLSSCWLSLPGSLCHFPCRVLLALVGKQTKQRHAVDSFLLSPWNH